jgi:hypothetical protein
MRRWRGLLGLGMALSLAAGCATKHVEKTAVAAPKAVPVTFADVTEAAGIHFVHNAGAFGKKWLPETMGAGAAFIDYDGDGWQDIYLVNGRDWTDAERREGKAPPATSHRRTTGALYHNRGNGTFEDVTKQAGLDVEMYGMGVTVGDYDNDGRPDLYVTGLGRNYLFHNMGGGKFEDVAERAGVKDHGWSTSASFVDYDKDGNLDLFVCHYVKWSPATDIYCTLDGHEKSYCTPQSYSGEPSRLYHNNGNGTFTDVTATANILKNPQGQVLQGKSLGCTICDYDNDGWPDIAVADDTEPNYLFHNNGDGTFKEEGTTVGVAYSEAGEARGAMGIDAADYDHSGRDSLVIGNFSNEMVALYRNQGTGLFIDMAPSSEVGQASLLYLAFGCFFFDMDNDGWHDLFTSNGHVEDDIQHVQKDVSYPQRPLLFRNLGGVSGGGSIRFQEVGLQSGEALRRPVVGRGVAYADYDLDGDTDILMCVNRGPARLLRNDGGNANGAIRLQLVGAKSNRSAIGAAVQVKVGADTRRYMVRSGSSYCSQSELPVQIGLGAIPQADAITVQWPSGQTTRLTAVKAGQRVTVREGQGIVASQPFVTRQASAPSPPLASAGAKP